ncbi:DUF732 domain-containing protein [Mycobacterium sherrisii]|uniref:DUF732 domain-containing protein n=1 Tax=Mycobacterium sherrisii TaxID=243061 RepID=A0A1E3SCH0_9MYCO|nr:DUF732 domain-containing protein [Mycobacterium sherrisii]MCV7031963.1 DUF732 domain-containing protein [Mycobacterium sherrisii]ODQ99819.1 hypothetical protein BHQ21_24960 [Mycobacterium sherrisii]ORW76770.1 hypothetical protein AWC25_11605 [Mycobacterium sherrisii]
MHTRIPHLAGAVVGLAAALTAALGYAGAAKADAQEDQFVALLAQLQIPVIDNVPGLVYRAQEICGELDHGTPFQSVVDEETNTTYASSPSLHLVPDRVTRTAVKFVTASVTVYCPRYQGLLP